jgi:anti-sigma-K factor RskA
MTISGFSSPACREIRLLLGVYVVGAIDPAERARVDEHLGECPLCRDELAGLAGLPAMLSRVPAADVEWLDATVTELPALEEPSDEMLAALLRKVSVKRRSRMWRSIAAVAAAAVIAAGGAAATMQLTRPPAQSVGDVATGASPSGLITAVVDYSPSAWGTAMRVHVTGIPAGTKCQFWVVGKDGRVSFAGTWTVGSSRYGSTSWYSASAAVPMGSVHQFRITSGSMLLVKIPAT